MSWARLDDRFPWHPKVLAAGNAAVGLWVRALAHCCAHGTRGFVGADIAKRLGTAREVAAVTSASLWVAVRGGESITVSGRKDSGKRPLPDVVVAMPGPGYFIRDFLHYHWKEEPLTASAPSPSRRENSENRHRPRRSSEISPEISGETQVRSQNSLVCANSEISASTSTVPKPPQTPPSGEGVVAPQPEPEPDREPPISANGRGFPPATDAERAVIDRLRDLGWRSKMLGSRFRGGWEALALRIVREQDLTRDALERLVVVAKAKTTGDPMDLVGRWVTPDGATWKDVLADEDMRARHAEARQRGRAAQVTSGRDVHPSDVARKSGEAVTIRDIGPVSGESNGAT